MPALVRALAAGRVVVGIAMILQPEAAVRGWIGGRAASDGGTRVMTQAFGARDLSLGAGALAALVSGRDARDWVLAGAFSDAVDLVATTTGEDIPLGGKLLVAGIASGAIVVGAAYLASGQES